MAEVVYTVVSDGNNPASSIILVCDSSLPSMNSMNFHASSACFEFLLIARLEPP
ncbi:hypothetical protein D3C71_2087940 [compost metagenome]